MLFEHGLLVYHIALIGAMEMVGEGMDELSERKYE